MPLYKLLEYCTLYQDCALFLGWYLQLVQTADKPGVPGDTARRASVVLHVAGVEYVLF
jgi:hypothetical protein